MDLKDIEQTLVTWQLQEESDLFKVIHRKNQREEELNDNELDYYNFYKRTYYMEIGSFMATFPIGLFAYKFSTERKKPIKVVKNINFWLGALAFTGLPAFHLFMWGAYRRYFSKHKFEDDLKLEHSQEISRMQRMNFKNKDIKPQQQQQQQVEEKKQ